MLCDWNLPLQLPSICQPTLSQTVFSILSILTNHVRHAFMPSNMSNHPEELYTQDEVPSLPVTQNSPTTSLAKLSTCSNERNEGDDQHTSELNKQDLSSPPKRYLLFVHLSGSPSLLDHECFPLDMNQLLAYLWIYTYGLNTCKHTVARSWCTVVECYLLYIFYCSLN